MIGDIVFSNSSALSSPEKKVIYEANDTSLVQEMKQLSKDLQIDEFISNQCYDNWNTSPNNFGVVDLDNEDPTKPTPVFYILEIENVVSFKKKNQKVLEIEFKLGDYNYLFTEQSRIKLKGEEVIQEAPHNLGYCPAIQISDMSLNNNSLAVINIFYRYLGSFFKVWIWDILKENSQLFAAFPIVYIEAEEQTVDNNPYVDDTMDDLMTDGTEPIHYENSNKPETNLNIGAGTVVTTQRIKSADGSVGELTAPIGVIEPNVDSLKFLSEKPQKIEESLIRMLSGVEPNPTKSQLNEEQVAANNKKRNTILKFVAEKMSRLRQFFEMTAQKEVFGDAFVNVIVDYGSKFDILDYNELVERYGKAKTTGINSVMRDAYMDLAAFKYKNSPSKFKREEIKNLVAIYSLREQTVLDKWLTDGTISFDEWYINTNIDALLNKFESQYISIPSGFNEDLSSQKIAKMIKDILVKELKESGISNENLTNEVLTEEKI